MKQQNSDKMIENISLFIINFLDLIFFCRATEVIIKIKKAAILMQIILRL